MIFSEFLDLQKLLRLNNLTINLLTNIILIKINLLLPQRYLQKYLKHMKCYLMKIRKNYMINVQLTMNRQIKISLKVQKKHNLIQSNQDKEIKKIFLTNLTNFFNKKFKIVQNLQLKVFINYCYK